MDSKDTPRSTWVNPAVWAVIVTVVGLAYAVGKDTNAGLTEMLKEEKIRLETNERRLQDEISSLKLELQNSLSIAKMPLRVQEEEEQHLPAKADVEDQKISSSNEATAEEAPAEIVQLTAQNSASVFDGKVIISLIGLSFEGSPFRHKVTATIGAPGKENIAVSKADVGSVFKFDGYEIRISSVDTFSATFVVNLPEA